MDQLIDQAVAAFIGVCIPAVSGGAIEPAMTLDQFEKADPSQRNDQAAEEDEDLFLVRSADIDGETVWLSIRGPYCRVYSEFGDKVAARQRLQKALAPFDAKLKQMEKNPAELWRGAFYLTDMDRINVVLSQRLGNAKGFHMSAFRSRHSTR